MDAERRKLHHKIDQRIGKVQKMLSQCAGELKELKPEDYADEKEHQRAISAVQSKITRLDEEMKSLNSGKLPGGWR